MIIYDGYKDLRLKRTVATMGIFDGVHRGHQVLLDHLADKAKESNGESVVITFFPHPRTVIDGIGADIKMLTTQDEKFERIGSAGIDHLVVIPFDEEFSRMPACDFIKDVLVSAIGVSHLVMGYNHRFGRRGEGDFSTIESCNESRSIILEKLDALNIDGYAVSSSAIRDLLLKGDTATANDLLGYNYQIGGVVTMGKQLGRTIGFPTANISTGSSGKLIPGNGVYIVDVIVENVSHKGMMSIGSNPTVNNDPSFKSIEVNILDFDTDIYGKNITVVFRHRLRDEQKFNGIGELKDQLRNDLEDTRRYFAELNK